MHKPLFRPLCSPLADQCLSSSKVRSVPVERRFDIKLLHMYMVLLYATQVLYSVIYCTLKHCMRCPVRTPTPSPVSLLKDCPFGCKLVLIWGVPLQRHMQSWARQPHCPSVHTCDICLRFALHSAGKQNKFILYFETYPSHWHAMSREMGWGYTLVSGL